MDSQLSLFSKNSKNWFDMPFLCIDTETTGLSASKNRVIEVAFILYEQQKEVLSESYLCRVDQPLPEIITQITGITDSMLAKEKIFEEISTNILSALNRAEFIVAYNAPFDKSFIEHEFKRAESIFPNKKWIDPLVFIKEFDKYKKGKKLTDACTRWNIKLDGAHRAMADTRATGQLLYKLVDSLKNKNLNKLDKLFTQQETWRKEQAAAYAQYKKRRRF